ncbi:F-box protein At5g65850-like [Telopea speciosissima]|uniref:F-box protein At5g65850-like n=1 Tax=Telopea speciosissima TaxID=54955 RepID=UPI001CC620BA|nr:F-box protein At5g65850-like [Telopea speciosissima]
MEDQQVKHHHHQHLPFDIISEILSRLPIESLMRFKSVCKSWFSLIKDQSFVELQFERSKKNQPHSSLILFNNYGPSDKKKLFLVDPEVTDKDKEDKDEKHIWKARDIMLLEYEWKYERDPKEKKLNFKIFGSCNGLLCMVSRLGYGCCISIYGIFICNPITKDCLMLPVPTGFLINCYVIGFGVDSTGKYKVLRIFFTKKCDDYAVMNCEIITLGESSWRKVEEEFPYTYTPQCEQDEMVFMNGALYTIIMPTSSQLQPFILVFDLHDEKFYTIQIQAPSIVELPRYYNLSLTSFIKDDYGQLLALHLRLPDRSKSVNPIWFMEINKYSNNGKELMYRCDSINMVETTKPILYHSNSYELVGMMTNDINTLLYRTDVFDTYSDNFFKNNKNAAGPSQLEPPRSSSSLVSFLLVYHLEKKQSMHVEVCGATIPIRFKATSFVPSLLSPIVIANSGNKSKIEKLPACSDDLIEPPPQKKSKKDTSYYRSQGLHLELVGYSSLHRS